MLDRLACGWYGLPMIDRETFRKFVHEAAAHLYDRPFLQTQALGELLTGRTGEAAVAELQKALLAAAEELKPAPATPLESPLWRQYQYFKRRYVDGAGLDRIADELAIGERQARRYNQESLDAIAALLWARYSRRLLEPGAPPPSPPQDSRGLALASELASLADAAPTAPTSLTTTLDSVLTTVAKLVASRRIVINAVLPPDLPPVAVHRVVLRQILLGLLVSVAERHSAVRVHLSALVRGQHLSIRIVVQQSRTSSVQQSARELPEPISLDPIRRLVEHQGGVLRAEQDGSGQEELRLELPASPLATVLVVDDNLDFRRLFQRFLEDSPYRAIFAEVTDDFVELARSKRPDLITVDVMMPTQDGWEVLPALKTEPATRDIPVIVCSVLQESTLALTLGATGVLVKPITRSELLAALDRCRFQHPRQSERSPGGDPARSAGSP